MVRSSAARLEQARLEGHSQQTGCSVEEVHVPTPCFRFVYDLDIPLVNGRVPFHKTAFELVKRTSQADIPDGQLKVGREAATQAHRS